LVTGRKYGRALHTKAPHTGVAGLREEGLCICKPDPVTALLPKQIERPSIIYLGPRSREASIDLPSGSGGQPSPALRRSPGIHGLSARGVYQAAPLTRHAGGLLPHLFTLTRLAAGGIPFCGTFRGTVVPDRPPSR